MDASVRGMVLAIPGMRQICDLLVNAGNKRYARVHSPERVYILDAVRESRTRNRCFIVGSGPSLTPEDLNSIAGEDCFAANHIFKVYGNTVWRPKYYVLQDRYTKLDRRLEDIDCQYMFLGSYFLRKSGFSIPANAYPFFDRRDVFNKEHLSFSDDVQDFISANYTVTYTMLQLAIALGYEEIFLLGIDHSYAVETNDKGAVVKRNNVKNHAYDDKQEVVANVAGMNRAYESAKYYVDSTGVARIYNATRGGKLEVFPRKRLEDVLSGR